MKKFLCILFIIILGVSLVGCSQDRTKIDSPLSLVNEVVDKYDNIIQQTYYNKDTGEYIIHEYFYEQQNGLWACVNHQTTFYLPDTPDYYSRPNCNLTVH